MAYPDRTTAELLNELPHLGYNRALAEAKAGRLVAARDMLVFVLQLDAAFVPALVLLGKVHAQLGDMHQAITRWEVALAIDADDSAARAGIEKATSILDRAARNSRLTLVLGIVALGILVLLGSQIPRSYRSLTRPAEGQVATAIQASWAANPSLSGADLEAVASDGVISLVGNAPTSAHKQLAVALATKQAAELYGVDGSEIAVQSLSRLANICLEANEDWLRELKVQQTGGELALGGLAPTQADRDWIVALAKAFAGSDKVNAEALDVVSPVEVVFANTDTLWKLAKRFYGDGNRWPDIYAANPHLPRNPRNIPTGIRVKVVLDPGGPIPAFLKEHRASKE